MNNMTKLFMVAIASAAATSSAFAANYSAGQPSGYPAYADQGQYYDQSPGMSGEHSYMRRADTNFSRMRQDNQNMYMQDRNMSREGYDPNESYYYGETNPSYPGQYGRHGRQDQPMHGDAGYSQGAYYNAGSDASAPQSYPLDDSTYPNAPRGANFRAQGPSGPRGYGNAYQNHPRDGSSRVVREDGHEIKHEGTDQHPVYEYMLGKDGKWHNVPSQNHNSNWQQSNGSYELGYNDDSRHGEKGSPESYALDDSSSAPKDSSDSSSRYSSYGSRQDRAGDASSSYNVNNRRTSSTSNWNTEEDNNLDQSSFNTGSSSTTKRNAQR